MLDFFKIFDRPREQVHDVLTNIINLFHACFFSTRIRITLDMEAVNNFRQEFQVYLSVCYFKYSFEYEIDMDVDSVRISRVKVFID